MRPALPPVALAVALAVLLCAGVQEAALHGHSGWSLARRGVAARNTLRHGLVATRFAPVETLGDTPGEPLVWYANHPALTSLLTALSIALFGEHEWAERVVPILFSIAAVLLLFAIARRARGPTFAVVAGVSALAMPMWTYYGAFVNHEPIVLFAALALVAGWLALREAERFAKATVVAATLLGTLDDWSFAFVLGPLAVWALLDARARKRTPQVLWIVVPAAAGLLAAAAHALSLPNETTELFRERLWGRSTLNLSIWEVATNPLVIPRAPALLGFAGAFGAAILPVLVWLRRREARADALDGAMLSVWVGAVLYAVILSEGLRNHDYWLFLFAPCAPVAIATILAEVPVRARSFVTGVTLVATLGFGLLSWHDLRRLPSELVEEWPTFRFEENQVMRHLRRRTAPEEWVLVEENVEMLHQWRYYLDRRWSWFRGQEGLGEWALGQGASMVLVPARAADGDALATLGSRFLLTVIGDHFVGDLRRGPGAVDARRIVTARRASLGWRYLRSLVYAPYRVEPDGARTRDLTTALWGRLGRTPPPTREDWRRRTDLEAKVARANAGEAGMLLGTLPVRVTSTGTVADLVGARLDARADGGLDVWVVVRAHASVPWVPLPIVWVSDMPERAADWGLLPRVPPAWWRDGALVAFHRTIGLTRGRHSVFLRRQQDDALGLDRDLELGTVTGDPRVPWLGRY
ncbi:MAG: glycosyltransferase family 39 protein [Micrococcales bacterium]|nr:glycosyltransferase family 39 protein [Micrococcales bacterium]